METQRGDVISMGEWEQNQLLTLQVNVPVTRKSDHPNPGKALEGQGVTSIIEEVTGMKPRREPHQRPRDASRSVGCQSLLKPIFRPFRFSKLTQI